MNLLITICARGGSKGIPGKNIKSIGGFPLLAYSIRHAQEFAKSTGADIALSTDSEEIKAVAADCGLVTDYVRPVEISGDDAGKEAAIRAVLFYEEENRGKKYDMVLDLDVSSPMRTQDDLRQALQIMQGDSDALTLFSVSPARRNPYFNMVELHESGYHRLVKTPDSPIVSRQTAPEVHDLNASFYFVRREFFNHNFTNFFTHKSLVYVVPHLCFDLDEPADFEYLEYLLREQKLGFAL